MNDKQPVSHYGLHGDGDLFFIHEQRRAVCATPGLDQLESPLIVERMDRLPCPHSLLPMDPPEPFPLPRMELIAKLAPVPDGGAYWIPTEAKDLLRPLLTMSRPIRSCVFVPWATPIRKLVNELTITNLAPLVIVDYQPRDLRPIAQLLALPRIRTVVLCGDMRMPEAKPVEWGSTLPNLPWERVGTSLLQALVASRVEEARL